MGKVVAKAANIASLGLIKESDILPEKINPQIADRNYFDLTKEVKPAQSQYAKLLEASEANQAAVAPAQANVLRQMGLAAQGQGPSLAEVQMKAAQDRNLAQQLAAMQAARGGSAAGKQRALLQNMSAAGRDIAQGAAQARLQERDQFLNQAGVANQALRSDITGKLNLDLMPKQALQNWEMARVGAVNQAQAQNAQMNNQLTGAIIGGAASVLGGAMSKKAATGGLITKEGVKTKPTEEYKKGGKVSGPGTGTSDSIPTLLSDGEFVVKASVVKKPGVLAYLEKLNAGKAKAPDALVSKAKEKIKKKDK